MAYTFSKDDCYFQVPIISTNRSSILSYALTQSFAQSGHNGKYSFLQIIVPEMFIREDTFLNFVAT